ncbi:N-acetylneuraminate synthase family protein [Synechococcus lacustris]|uniref:N-acetylneuraminate synthase n=1 Tax=Synechococcus lacustris str. Tous TaxID=1910958 RepID=A0A2P7EBQ0_9SYNE|nr:N-acetylneuraminate synthase family protein [Synechococcus lacustris]PSI00628.1 N-acetylneuraminate synthase [Synechococcus lacustris str. Tous]
MEIIAEIAQAHEGSLGNALSYVNACAKHGIKTIKFQIHIAEEESSPKEQFRIPFSLQDASRYDYWKRTSFSLDHWRIIKNHCDKLGITFLASPFSLTAVSWLNSLGVEVFKIGSADIVNQILLHEVRKTAKRVILSSGLSSLSTLKTAVSCFESAGISVDILHCVSSYPCTPEQININKINELKAIFPGTRVGFSDHSGSVYGGIIAATIGAEIYEFHLCFDRLQFGPDSTSSIEIREIPLLLSGVDFAIKAKEAKAHNQSLSHNLRIFAKSIISRRDLCVNDVIRIEDLDFRKLNGDGIDVENVDSVIGQTLTHNVRAGHVFSKEDFQ